MSKRSATEIAKRAYLILRVVDAGDDRVLIGRATSCLEHVLTHGVVEVDKRVSA